ncbi:hypothetical protein MO867_16030 [Microbulbifer sp. OS29]|uniref:Cupin domain-containing protein n=1 Tax=Microbulbifer okhotskensis TaxID=2926617 RepID=A0A9X2EQA7_9GAMM|nr:hypothetical protein [Microbulbifer okhotskensis]MCO1335844.1 hypothetical protein [Microbulbifer okhotskensis]
MKYIELYSVNGISTFRQGSIETALEQKLGNYSAPYPVKQLFFREFAKGQCFDWHCAPQAQFIIYLEGSLKITIRSGEQHTFGPGDILLAKDLQGEGHISETLSSGRAAIVVVNDSPDHN